MFIGTSKPQFVLELYSLVQVSPNFFSLHKSSSWTFLLGYSLLFIFGVTLCAYVVHSLMTGILSGHLVWSFNELCLKTPESYHWLHFLQFNPLHHITLIPIKFYLNPSNIIPQHPTRVWCLTFLFSFHSFVWFSLWLFKSFLLLF